MNTPQVCVLGAGGAIGSRVVQDFLARGVSVTAVVRRLETAIRIGRWPVKVEVADLGSISEEELSSILKGHTSVVDCSYSVAADVEQNKFQSDRLATSLKACCDQLAIPNLVHFGTISVYPTANNIVDEQVECHLQGEAYADGKLVAEQTLLSGTNMTNVLVLQLPIVVGPFMGWTKSIVHQLCNKTLVFPEPISGRCNAVFVDDVVHATRLGLDFLDGQAPGSVSERILIGGADRSWIELYSAHSEALANSEIVLIPRSEYSARLAASQLANQPWPRMKRAFAEDGDFRQLVLAQWGIRSLYKFVKKRRGQSGVDQIKSRLSRQSKKLQAASAEMLLAQGHFHTFDTMPAFESDKANKLLNYSAQYDFDESIDLSIEWAQWAGLVT